MAESFLSSSWFRVANLRPRLREDVEIARHRYQSKAWYILRDPISGQTHRVPPAAYQFIGHMDGKHTVDEVYAELFADLGAKAPSQNDVVTLMTQLYSADLLQTDAAPDSKELFERHSKQARDKFIGYLKSPFAIRVPLVNPNKMLDATAGVIAPLFSKFGAILWLAIICSAAALVGLHWPELTDNFGDRILAYGNLPLLAGAYILVKGLHELGHAYAIKTFGGEVRDMGVMLLVFFPVPYVDASASTAFRNKWRRATVGAAGIFVELFLAAVAMHCWTMVEPGVIRAFLFNVMLIGGISTVLFNGNPLLRFDGYYVLSDLIEIPNLAQRASQYWGYVFERYLFRAHGQVAVETSRWERAWFFLYAPASFIYRMVVLASLALFVSSQFFIIGVLFAGWAVLSGVVFPLGKMILSVANAPRLRRRRTRAVIITYGGIAAFVLFLIFVPLPSHTTTEGIVWLPDASTVKAGSDGFVETLLSRPGDSVHAGDPLVEVVEPVLESQIQTIKARIDELEAQHVAERFNDLTKAQVAALEIEKEKASLEREYVRRRRATVTSATDGIFVVPNASDVIGRFVKEGTVIAYVTPRTTRTLRILVSQGEIDLVHKHVERIEVKLSDRLSRSFPAAIVREVPAAAQELPSKALGLSGGGQFIADPRDPKGIKSMQRLFQFDIELTEGPARMSFGSRAYVRFEFAWEPLGSQLYRRARQLFLSKFNA